jgi:hypothetical protein
VGKHHDPEVPWAGPLLMLSFIYLFTDPHRDALE